MSCSRRNCPGVANAGRFTGAGRSRDGIGVNACMGPVSLLSFATARIPTALADDTVSIYGGPIYR
ncbi:MspA family porin [Nocardia brasiliensis]